MPFLHERRRRPLVRIYEGDQMACVLLEETEIEVAEDVEQVLGKIVHARDGIAAPAGWIVLSAPGTGAQIFMQVARIACVWEGSGGVVGGDREHDVPASEAQVGVQLDRPPVERRHGHVGEGDEVPLGGVEHVRHTAAVAIARQRQHSLDAVALGLDPDALRPQVDPRLIASRRWLAGVHL
jgi:hypothetical protein